MSVGAFYEFFAGGGMARAGLGPQWRCLFANDIDPAKAESYRRNWGDSHFSLADVARLTPADLPETPDLVWASSPCQDVSLAGDGAGLGGARSGAFWPFWDLMRGLAAEDRAPLIIALENVCGLLTSRGGADFADVLRAYRDLGYRVGALTIDAADFLPQSRPRLFVIGLRGDVSAPEMLASAAAPPSEADDSRLLRAQRGLPDALRADWVWWRLPPPERRNSALIDMIEPGDADTPWHTSRETKRLLSLMTPRHRDKLARAQDSGRRMVGAVYKRGRPDGKGGRAQRAEIRFDGMAGCLRTPLGGSSRQIIMIVEGASLRSRLLSARESARLMGLSDEYKLPDNYIEACHLTGDGVAVPVVRHLATNLFRPLLRAARTDTQSSAATLATAA